MNSSAESRLTKHLKCLTLTDKEVIVCGTMTRADRHMSMKLAVYCLFCSLCIFLSFALYSLWHNRAGTSLLVQFTNLPLKVLNLFEPLEAHQSLFHLVFHFGAAL